MCITVPCVAAVIAALKAMTSDAVVCADDEGDRASQAARAVYGAIAETSQGSFVLWPAGHRENHAGQGVLPSSLNFWEVGFGQERFLLPSLVVLR